MAIDAASGATASSLSAYTNATSGTKSAVSKDEFLKMLVAQLEHQNPLDPQDGAAFVAQLAQFSALEQSTETNQRLASLQNGQEGQSRAALTNLVGRNVTVAASNFTMGAGGGMPPSLSVKMTAPIDKGQLVVRDAAGNTVRTIDLGARATGDSPILWPQGAVLPPGQYTIEVSGTNSAGGKVTGTAQMTGKVDALDFSSGSPRLRVGAAVIAPGDVQSILQ